MRRRRKRHGALWGTAGFLAVLAGALGAFLFRQVDTECRAFLDGQRSRLEERLQLALAGIEVLERATFDALARQDGGEALAASARRVEDEHPIARQVFMIRGESIEWPPAGPRASLLDPRLWRDAADDPAARQFFGRVDEKLAAGDAPGALATLERGPERPLSPAARAEADLRLATLLAPDPARAPEALAAFDRVIALAPSAEGPDAEIPPWATAARLRKGLFLLERDDAEAGARELLGLLGDLTRKEDAPADGAAVFYLDRSIEALLRLESQAKLAAADAHSFGALRARVERWRSEAAFRHELERDHIPRIRAAAKEGTAAARVVGWRQDGPDVIAFRHVPDADGGPGRIVGFRAEMNLLLDEMLQPLGSSVGLRDQEGRLLRGSEARAEKVTARAGGGFPWTIEAPAGEELKAYRSRRYMLYGGGLAVGLLLAGAAAFATLRGMARDIELADLKGEFVANVSHELKTPLTLIRMFSDLLRLGYAKSAEETEKSLEVISREADNLGFLIDNVLEASRIEAGEAAYRPEPVDPAIVARRVVEEYRPYAERKGFTVRFQAGPVLPSVALDQVAFTHAFKNLLSNAVKYAEDSKEIEVSVHAEGLWVVVAVADRGVGLGGADQRRIFERFYRAPRPGQAAAGAGIGLAIVKHVVEAHGGTVEARNRDGGGSVFAMRFPAKGDGGASDEGTDPRH